MRTAAIPSLSCDLFLKREFLACDGQTGKINFEPHASSLSLSMW